MKNNLKINSKKLARYDKTFYLYIVNKAQTLKTNKMSTTSFQIGQKVVQSKGDIQGRVGVILEIIGDKIKVKWEAGYLTTKIKVASLSDASIPYIVIPWSFCKKTGRQTNAKYIRS